MARWRKTYLKAPRAAMIFEASQEAMREVFHLMKRRNDSSMAALAAELVGRRLPAGACITAVDSTMFGRSVLIRVDNCPVDFTLPGFTSSRA